MTENHTGDEQTLDQDAQEVEKRYQGRMRSSDQITTVMVDRLLTLYEKDLKYRKIRVFFIAIAIFLGSTYYITFDKIWNPANFIGEYAAMVRLQGEIGAGEKISALNINPALVKAFKDKNAKGVVLLINSPGGSPVQSSIIHDRIIQLRQQYPDKRVVVVAEDVLASGGYFIASGAEAIYVNRSTLIGSIGARMDGFHIDLNKSFYTDLGLQRRTITAGGRKDRLNMFKPASTEDMAWAQSILKQTHGHFIDAVLETRADKLKEEHDVLFSGELWNGAEAVKLGLADGLSDLTTVLKEEFDVEGVVDYTPAPSFFAKIQQSYGVFAELAKMLTAESGSIQMR